MAQPPPAPGPAPPPGAPPYPGYPPAVPPPYPPPPPKQDNTLVIIIVLLLVVFVVIPAILAVYFFVILAPVVRNPGGKPLVGFSPVNEAQGNVSFTVAAISQNTIAGFFEVNLRVNGAPGSAEPLRESPNYATYLIDGITYRVYWEDLGGVAYLNSGDGFRVTGDGAPLTAGSYEFHLLWVFDGSQVTVTTWAI